MLEVVGEVDWERVFVVEDGLVELAVDGAFVEGLVGGAEFVEAFASAGVGVFAASGDADGAFFAAVTGGGEVVFALAACADDDSHGDFGVWEFFAEAVFEEAEVVGAEEFGLVDDEGDGGG